MFRLRLPRVSLPFSLRAKQVELDHWFMYELDQLLEHEISNIAESAFGSSGIAVNIKELRFGSVEVLATIYLVGVSAYKFFKEYEDLRAGIRLFVLDIKRAGSHLENMLNEKISAKEKKVMAEAEEAKSIHRMRFGR